MPKKKLRPPTKTEEDQLFDALLGPDEDLDVESAREIVEAYGTNPSELVSKLKARLDEEARQFRLRGMSVPPLIQNTLQNLRTGPAPDPVATDPVAWLDGLLGGTLQLAKEQVAYSLRPRKPGDQLSRNDQRILDTLNDEIEDEEKTN